MTRLFSVDETSGREHPLFATGLSVWPCFLFAGWGRSSNPVRSRVAPVPTVCEMLGRLNQFNGWSRLIYLVLIGSKKTFHSHGLSGRNSRTERHPCVLDQSSGGVRSRAESQQWFQVIDLQKLHSHVAVRVREKTIPDRASRPRKACCSFLQAYRVNYSVPFWTYLKLHTCWRIFARVTHEHT